MRAVRAASSRARHQTAGTFPKPASLFPPGSPASFLVGAPRPRGLRRLPLSSPSPACSEEVMHRVRSVGVSAQTHNDVVEARQDLRSQL